MKLTVLSWFNEAIVRVLGKTVEVIFRLLLCLLPLGVYMLILQKRPKASAVSSISVYTKENSKFQHVFPGFLLVSIDPESLNNFISQKNASIQSWVNQNKYTLALVFMSVIVGLMVLSYIKGGTL